MEFWTDDKKRSEFDLGSAFFVTQRALGDCVIKKTDTANELIYEEINNLIN